MRTRNAGERQPHIPSSRLEFYCLVGPASLSQTFWQVFCRTIIGELCRVFFARPIFDVFPNFRCTTMLCVDSNRPDGMRWVKSLNSSSSCFAAFDHHAAGK